MTKKLFKYIIKKKWLFLIIIFFIGLSIPYIIYWLSFKNNVISDKSSDWSNFGAYISGSLTPLIMVVGIIITYLINKTNIERENMRQKPLLYLTYSDSQYEMCVRIINKGVGVLKIKNYELKDIKTGKTYSGFFDLLSDLGENYILHTSNEAQLLLSPLEEKVLLSAKNDRLTLDFEKQMNEIRSRCENISVNIDYTDIYEKNNFNYSKSLEWLGRHNKNFSIENE